MGRPEVDWEGLSRMRVPVVLLCAVLLTACASRQQNEPAPAGAPPNIRTAVPSLLKTNRNVVVTQGRNLRSQGNIQAAKKVKYIFKPASDLPPHDLAVMKILLNAEALDINRDYEPAKGTPTARGEHTWKAF